MNVVLSFKALKSATAPDTRVRIYVSTCLNVIPKCYQVVIQNLGLRLHLCADTMSAISVFVSDLITALNPTLEHQYGIFSAKNSNANIVIKNSQTQEEAYGHI